MTRMKSRADIELEQWWDARQAARAASSTEDADKRAEYYAAKAEAAIAWTRKPLVERLQDVLDENEWDMSSRDIATLKEAIEALEGDWLPNSPQARKALRGRLGT
jgi:RecA-family ATPase